ncbi:hypothetical protein CEUSTIGMA_g8647.t1 [Chlamydomonas eustigma]|uniref:Uncharacterized protein n=1 Tax=Chlamydomonas eustigma TaxID=1157962 RepID=A0A250XDQ4_9CHLO|nr:hypothetical protein CEUSTIGMA_g8647.t1 [Chlamydomonas eustigma]|eukprot:GAX81215.1 hypothetical protein CEUSTIGMA_g8647.t1 [Chlamydomonas eustigma]
MDEAPDQVVTEVTPNENVEERYGPDIQELEPEIAKHHEEEAGQNNMQENIPFQNVTLETGVYSHEHNEPSSQHLDNSVSDESVAPVETTDARERVEAHPKEGTPFQDQAEHEAVTSASAPIDALGGRPTSLDSLLGASTAISGDITKVMSPEDLELCRQDSTSISSAEARINRKSAITSIIQSWDEQGEDGPEPLLDAQSTATEQNLMGVEHLESQSRVATPQINTHAKEGSFSAPLSPSGEDSGSSSISSMSRRRKAIHMATVLANRTDLAMLARETVIQEREESEALRRALDAKLEAAARRRASVVPEPQSHLTTPVSLTMKTLPGLTPRSSAWKDSFIMNSHQEVLYSTKQHASALEISLKEEQQRFILEAKMAREQEEAARRRQAEVEAKAAGLKEKRQHHINQVLGLSAQNQERRRIEMESRQRAVEERSSRLLRSTSEQTRSSLQSRSASWERKAAEARQRQDQYDHNRAMARLNDYVRRYLSPQRSFPRREVCTASVERAHKREFETLHRGEMEREKERMHFQQKALRVDHAAERAASVKGQRLNHLSHSISEKMRHRFSSLEMNHMKNEQYLHNKHENVLEKHARIDALLAQKKNHFKHHMQQAQRRQTAELMTKHWSKEIQLQTAIDNKLPVVKKDLVENIKKVVKA